MEVGWEMLIEEVEDAETEEVDVTEVDESELVDASVVDSEGVGMVEVGLVLVLVLGAADVLGSAEVCLALLAFEVGVVLLLGVLSAVAAGTGSAKTVLGGFGGSSLSSAGWFFCLSSMRRP
jgi:hypothetical protein